jgi:uncharacterized protein YjaZ
VKRLIILFLFGTLFLLNAGCANKDAQSADPESAPAESQVQNVSSSPSQESSSEFSVKGQSFHIAFLNSEILDYAQTMKGDSSLVVKDVFSQKVIVPLEQKLSIADAHSYYELDSVFLPNTDPQKLEVKTKELMVKEAKIGKLIEEALGDAAGQLSGVDKTVVVMPANPRDVFTIDKKGGVSGFVLSENLFMLEVDPSFNEEVLQYTIAQLYHHTVQVEKMADVAGTLMESFVIDGKADAFANKVYPGTKVPWTDPLSDRLKEKVFEELEESGNELTDNFYAVFTGNARRGIPLWSNYKLGYEITQSYLQNHPETGVEDWTGLQPIDIINGSEFKDEFEALQNITE